MQEDFPTTQSSFVARILGGIFFGIISDKLGRKISISMSSLILTICTVFIMLVPSYQCIGIMSTCIFMFLRFIQGLCFGGEVSNLIVYVLETEKSKHLYSAKITVSSTFGALLATCTALFLNHFFSQNDILNYAWRLPFFISFISVCFSIIIRLKIKESPIFLQNETKKKNKFCFDFSSVIKVMLAIALGACSFYVINTSILFLNTEYHLKSEYLQIICSIILLVLILISGSISRIMAKKGISVLKLGVLLSAFLSIPVFYVISQKNYFSSIMSLLIFIIITSMVQANLPLLALNLTKFSGRSLNLSLGYNLGIIIFGSSAPYFIHLFYNKAIKDIGYYISIISFISYLSIKYALPKIGNTSHAITTKF